MSSSSGTSSTAAAAFDPSTDNYKAGYAAGQSATAAATAQAASTGTTTSPGVIRTDNNTGFIVTGVVSGVIVLFLAYYYLFRTSDVPFGSRFVSFLTYSIVILLLAFGSWFIFQGVMGQKSKSGNLVGTPIDSATPLTIQGGSVPPQAGVNGGNYGIQWWMYIKDWDTKFGTKKTILKRGTTGTLCPYVYLGETDNSLSVQIDQIQATGTTASSTTPFICTLTNVPLQTWFCVGLSVSGRNVDLYQDGKLLRSCLLPGVPVRPAGNISVMSDGGFSGNVVDLFFYSRALNPTDAATFFSAGTSGTSYTASALPSRSLFGYSVHLGLSDSNGNVLKDFTI
jgi:hypothetical protein